jgi:hypothetical protein
MDQKVIQEGIDPSLPDSVRAYYAAVPVGYVFCDSVKYEILKELFLIDPVIDSLDNAVALAKRSNAPADPFLATLGAYDISLRELDMEALRITGNLAERIKEIDTTGFGLGKSAKAQALFSKGHRPKGTITYQDTELGVKPVVGARITAGYWYLWKSSVTDANGYF